MLPDALIVGAGPVGLTMAVELARYGVSVRIVDKAARRTDKSKALVLWSRTLELLDRTGCAAALIAAGNKVHAASIVASGKTIANIGFDGVDSPYPYALMLPQSDTERLLDAHLATLGVAVEREVELTCFTADTACVTATLKHPDGSNESVNAGWLLGCDGSHSTIRHALNLQFAGDTLPSDWVLADVHLTGLDFPASELVMFWHGDGVLLLFPISPGRYRIIADVVSASDPHPADPTLADVQRIVDQRGPGGIALSDPIWLSAFRINERKVADYRAGRVFVAGDAAHVHSPAGGQGMNTGMQDAVNLAWKLALVCQGTCAPAMLDSYSAERSPVGAQVLAGTRRLTAMAVLSNHTAQAVRDVAAKVLLGLAPVRRAMANQLAEVSIGYGHSPLNGINAHLQFMPAPGQRMPPIAGQMPFGAGNAPRFALFATPSEAASHLQADHAALLETALRPPPSNTGFALVRPDGYVAMTAARDELPAVRGYLDRIAAPAG